MPRTKQSVECFCVVTTKRCLHNVTKRNGIPEQVFRVNGRQWVIHSWQIHVVVVERFNVWVLLWSSFAMQRMGLISFAAYQQPLTSDQSQVTLDRCYFQSIEQVWR